MYMSNMVFLLFRTAIICYFSVNLLHAQDESLNDLQQQGDEAYQAKEYQKAGEKYMEAFHLMNSASEVKGKLAFRIANTKKVLGDADEAKQWYKTSADIFEKIGKWDNHYIAKSKLADVLDDEGSYSLAISIAEEITSHFQKQKEPD